MNTENKHEKVLWLLRGPQEEPGWRDLESDSKSGKVDLVIFDRGASWALVWDVAPPEKYEGMVPEPPRDGLYVSEQGYPIYVVGCKEVRDAAAVVAAIGGRAKELFDEIGDADTALQRAGLAF